MHNLSQNQDKTKDKCLSQCNIKLVLQKSEAKSEGKLSLHI